MSRIFSLKQMVSFWSCASASHRVSDAWSSARLETFLASIESFYSKLPSWPLVYSPCCWRWPIRSHGSSPSAFSWEPSTAASWPWSDPLLLIWLASKTLRRQLVFYWVSTLYRWQPDPPWQVGSTSTISFITDLTLPWGTGALYEALGSYQMPFLLAGCPPILCAFMMLFIHRVKDKKEKSNNNDVIGNPMADITYPVPDMPQEKIQGSINLRRFFVSPIEISWVSWLFV